jgi:hypothetical protein
MALPGAPRPIGFTGWIDVQHDAGHFGPIRAFGVGIEQTQIRDEMFVIIVGQTVGHRGLVGNRGIERRLGHDHVRLCFSYEGLRPSQGFPRTGVIIVGAMIRHDDRVRGHLEGGFPLF